MHSPSETHFHGAFYSTIDCSSQSESVQATKLIKYLYFPSTRVPSAKIATAKPFGIATIVSRGVDGRREALVNGVKRCLADPKALRMGEVVQNLSKEMEIQSG